jgi:exosome complex protein LRP1
MSLVDDLLTKTLDFQQSLSAVQQRLSELFLVDIDTRLQSLDNSQRAKLQATLAFSISTLIFLLLKINGESSKGHPVKDELIRLKDYFEKVNNIMGIDRRTIKVDLGAAKRFIKSGVGETGDNDVKGIFCFIKGKKGVSKKSQKHSKKSMG